MAYFVHYLLGPHCKIFYVWKQPLICVNKIRCYYICKEKLPNSFNKILIKYQRSKFASAVDICRVFCRGISPFYSICLGNKNAEAVKFLEIKKKKVLLELKKKFLVKEKKISFIKKPFFTRQNYSYASMFIIHTFISYIDNSLL